MTNTIFVTGASGHLGRAIINHLLADQKVAPEHIIVGSRSPDKLADLAAKGIGIRKADFDDLAGLEKAFAGVGTLLIISTDALDGAGTRLRQHKNAVSAAQNVGVKRIAYTSLPLAETSKVSFAPDHLGTEQAIAATGIPHLIFRNGWYVENLAMSLPQALTSGKWYTSAGSGKTTYAWRDDIAAAIAAALANPPVASTVWNLSGSEALTNAEIAGIVSEVLSRKTEIVDLTDEQLAGGMKQAGVPELIIPTLVSLDTAARAGDLGFVTGDIEKLSGHKPRSVRDWLIANKAAFSA